MRLKKILVGTSVAIFLTIGFTRESQHFNIFAQSAQTTGTVSVAVGPQYDTTHVYVAPPRFRRLRCKLDGYIWGHNDQAGRLHSNPDAKQHHVPIGADSCRHHISLWL